jgi:hypothetical protein
MNRIPVIIDRDLNIHIGPRPGDGLIVTLQLDRVAAQDVADGLNEYCGRRASVSDEFERTIDATVIFETEREREARAAAEAAA